MFLNTLGCNNNGEPYSVNRRFLCMVNCSPTMLGNTQQCSHSNRPTKQKGRPNQLIWKPPSCPQLATRPTITRQASEQEHDNEISGDIFTVGKKRSRKESLSVEHDDIPFKKAHQRFPTTQLNQPSRENLRDANSCGEKEQTILKTTKRQKSVASSFAMYHEGVPDHAICTVTDTKKHYRFTDFQGKSIQDIQSLFNANPTRYFEHYTRVSFVRRALRDTLLGANSPCWTLTIASIPHQTYQQRQKATTTGTKRHAPIVLIQRHKHSAKKQKKS